MTQSNHDQKKHNAKNRRQGRHCPEDSTTPRHYSEVSGHTSSAAQISTTPLWDDSNGAIYSIPDLPQRSSDDTHADIARGSMSSKDASNHVTSKAEFSYADIIRRDPDVNDVVQPTQGPRALWTSGNDGDRRPVGIPHRPTPFGLNKRYFANRFIPYFEPEDVRNADDLARPTGINAEVVPGASSTKKEPKQMFVKVETAKSPSIPDTKTGALQRGLASSIKLSVGSMSGFQAFRTPAKGAQLKTSTIKQPPSSSTVKKTNNRLRKLKPGTSATLDKVCQLRAEELQLPPITISDPDWSAQLRELAGAPTDLVEPNLSKSVVSVQHEDESAAVDCEDASDLAQKAKAMTVNQDQSSSKPARCASMEDSAVPEGLKLENVKTATIEQKVAVVKEDTSSSTQSATSSEPEEFQRVAIPLWDEAEKNGGKRRWYRFSQ